MRKGFPIGLIVVGLLMFGVGLWQAFAGVGSTIGSIASTTMIGSPWTAAFSSFGLFAAGAIIPVLPYLFGMSGLPAVFLAAGLVGVALLVTGGIVGILSGGPPLRRGLRQLAIGWGAAAVTYLLGLAFGTTVT